MQICASTVASSQLRPHGSVRQHDVRAHNGVLGCKDSAQVSRMTLAMSSLGAFVGQDPRGIIKWAHKQVEINNLNIRRDDDTSVPAPI